MRSLYIIVIIILLLLSKVYAQNYYTICDTSDTIAKFYFIIQDNELYRPNSIYIKLNDYITNQQVEKTINDILDQSNVNSFIIKKIQRPFKIFEPQYLSNNIYNRIVKISFNSNLNSWQIAKILQESNKFEYVLPEKVYKLSSIESNDPLNSKMDYLELLQVNQLWNIAKGDSSIAIGIVDSGVMTEHEDLKNSCKINSYEIPDDNKDNDNNGFIDDYYGWDFVGDISVEDFYNENYKPDNDVSPSNSNNSHGTHVAGITSAITNNNKGVSSIGYNLYYIPVKVTADNVSQLNYIIKPFEGILYALNRGAKVINCSWLSNASDPLAQDIANEVVARGSIIVCAAGNDDLNLNYYPYITPAVLNNVITVGATDNQMNPTNFTNFGYSVNIYAPGVNIFSTLPNNQYGIKSGTSMSSPIVASLIGLLKKIHKEWDYKQILTHLKMTSRDIENKMINDDLKAKAIDPVSLLRNNYIYNDSTPGLAIIDYYIQNKNYIDSINKNYDLIVKIKNYFKSVSNISIIIKPINTPFIQLDSNKFTFIKIKNNEEIELRITMKLNDNTPYFEGNLPIALVFQNNTNPTYILNREFIEISYKIESATKFMTVHTFPKYEDFTWSLVKSPSRYSLWAIDTLYSNNLTKIFSFGQHYQPITFSREIVAFHPFSSSKAIFALNPISNNEQSELALTENGGLAFKIIAKPFVRIFDIHFFDDKNGIVYGTDDNFTTKAKITNDGGNNWNEISLFKNSDESIIKQYTYKNNKTAFTTALGYIYISDSLGNNFYRLAGKAPTNYSKIALSDNNTIIFLQNEQDAHLISIYQDSGRVIKKVNIDYSNQYLDFYFLNNSEILYCLLGDGQILYSDNYFKTYHHILNKDSKSGSLQNGTFYSDSCGIRVWQINQNIYFSDIENVSSNINRRLSTIGAASLTFDSLEIGKTSANQTIFCNNISEGVITIQSQSFSDYSDKSFVLEKAFPKFINPCQLYDAKILFQPDKKGWHYDTLTIFSNSKYGEIKYYLSGFAYDPSSIQQSDEDNYIIYPNPATDFINLNLSKDDNFEIDLINNYGEVIKRIVNYTSRDYIDISQIPIGLYLIKIYNNKYYKPLKLIVNR